MSYPGLYPLAPGDSLAVSEAREIPSIRLQKASKDKLYTIGRFTHLPLSVNPFIYPPAMVDPDAPSRKNPWAAQWLHWILTNVKGEEEEEETLYNRHFLLPQVNTCSLERTWWETK